MSRIMVVGGGEWQIPIIKKARSMGHIVICSNLYPDSPAFSYADICEVADVLNREQNLHIAQIHKPDAIITDQSDIAVTTVAWLCEKLSLHGIGSDIAELFTNKYKMRLFCKTHGFPSPDFHLCATAFDAYPMLEQHGRIVIKPIDSQSSRGVFLIETRQELDLAFPISMGFSNFSKMVLAEQYVDGTEFTVDGIQTHGGYHVLAISEKKHYPDYPNIARSLLFEHDNPQYSYEALEALNLDMVKQMGFPFGLTHAEYKYSQGEFYLIEIAARGGGTRISSDIVPFMSGVDSNGLYIQMALGQVVEVVPKRILSRCAILRFMDFAPGRVKEIWGLDKVAGMNGVLTVSISCKEGGEILPMSDDRSRPGYYIAYADHRDDLLDLSDKVDATIQIVYDR